MNTLENKVALVTGGANGIGAEIVKAFLNEGAKVSVTILDINESAANELVQNLAGKHGKDRIQFIKCDVSKEDQLLDAFEKVNHQFQYIDVIVNNAGIADESFDMYQKEIDLNFINQTAVITSSLRGIEFMRKDKAGKGGTIINVSSICGLIRMCPGLFLYGAIKSALIHFGSSIGMKEYYSRTNVRVITICFGVTQSNLALTAKSFDEEINRDNEQIMRNFTLRSPLQPAEVAAKGVVESFTNGESGSVWLVNNGKICDITDNIDQAFEVMSEKVNI
ncbi:15-hydroxyprostaglandin dehydrogenase [NAD(+)]-like [Zerene cesonia]|uniref:15-hydroxyprostaglandin dehydrogenase [NAD(+)]-like n=1 Tax=Zerene cesonia TaxID=33412 RepID=UPI0018E59E9F|nr:15-hydroxyprostaglandin dehydrogenase [NAD(+)]-like [Zerene cesonia]